ncbi:MAG: GNAT family N-acetyltransferase [Fimbriiglobus sp.]
MNALQARPIRVDSIEYQEISAWIHPESNAFVNNYLRENIPRRENDDGCKIWIYVCAENDIVGFGTLVFGDEFPKYSAGFPHFYIPLLSVHPQMQGKGIGKQILTHLIETATAESLLNPSCYHSLFLDVYQTSLAAIGMYQKFGFVQIGEAVADDGDINGPYLIMARRLCA